MKKILLLLGCIFLITGCKVEYSLVINNDLTVEEEVNMTGTDEFFDNYYKSSKINVVNMVFNKNRQDILNKNNYSFEIIDQYKPYVLAKKKYNNIDDYAKNTIFYEQYFKDINISENNGVIAFKTGEFIPNNPDSLERYDIKTSSIKIKIPYKVIENNASSVDKETNTYIWYLGAETDDFSISFSYDSKEIFAPQKNNNNIVFIILITIVIVGLIILYAVNKKNKNK